MSTPADDSLGALFGLLSAAVGVALYIWTALALSAMFRKMGEDAWKGWVPLLNTATVLSWGGFSPWLILLVLVPIVGPVAVLALLIISAHRINAGFGYGAGMTVLAALLFVVWASILGFGPARWLGARRARIAPAGRTGDAVPSSPGGAAQPVVPANGPTAPPPAAAPSPAPAGVVLPAPPLSDAPPAATPDPDGFAPFAPPVSETSGWTPPETSPRPPAPPTQPSAPPAYSAPPPAAPPPAATSGIEAEDGDAAWPSEVDDVSAIHPSPFPPNAAAGRPFVAPPVAGDSGPIAFVPGRRTGADAAVPPAPVTRVPAARAVDPNPAAPTLPPTAERDADAVPSLFATPARARRSFDDDADAFPELSGEVSAVVGAPTAGTPRSATGAVSAQHRRLGDVAGGPEAEVDERTRALPGRRVVEDDIDQTVIARRAVRPVWELVPASGSPIPLTASVVILGRKPAGDPAFPGAQLLAVADDARTVSKTHARIEQRGENWIVTDLGSTNGVLVRTLMGDEVEVEPGGQLDAGERFFLGDEEFHLRRIAR